MLAGLGLLQIGLNEMPMQVGFGLLTLLSGFDLFYVALEPSLAVAGLLSAVGFLIALAALPPSRLEMAEKLEQLRVLESGKKIAIRSVPSAARGIDTPADYAAFVERRLAG